MDISNIDELLMSGKTTTHPATPEDSYSEKAQEVEEQAQDQNEYEEFQNDDAKEIESNDEPEHDEKPIKEPETDDYGNEKEPENEVIRERLARQARKHQAEIDALRAQLAQQGASREVQQAAKEFEYDPEASGDWQQQLASFVKQTVNSMTREQEESRQRAEDAKVQAEFETKFRQGMERFSDFTDVIESLPCQITNPMTLATRAMNDPAAFLYAAAKRHPQELERISKMRDPYAQMTEIGKLDERMRKNKASTQAPRPLSRSHDDAPIAQPKKKKEPNGDDLLAQADAKRINTVKQRLRVNR